jgi:hypothetical protein
MTAAMSAPIGSTRYVLDQIGQTSGAFPPAVLALVEQHEAAVRAINANADLTPAAKARQIDERREAARVALAAHEAAELREVLAAIDRAEAEARAALLPTGPGVRALGQTETEWHGVLLGAIAARLDRADRRAQAQADILLIEDADAADVAARAEDAALLNDPAVTPIVLAAATKRLDAILRDTPEHQRASGGLQARAARVRHLLAQYRQAHPGPTETLAQIAARRAAETARVQSRYRAVAQAAGLLR